MRRTFFITGDQKERRTVSLTDFDRARECVAEGREAIRNQKPELEWLARTVNRGSE